MIRVSFFNYLFILERSIILISWTVYLLFIIGLIAVIKGADWAVDSAVWLSKSFGIPEVIVGATIVSIGTTLPETMISALGAYR
ncbi:MAG: hypothetical protein GX994_08870, partial [Firmicutes bacterium]|nr:hypothetical protein [Bacillota bacterium]